LPAAFRRDRRIRTPLRSGSRPSRSSGGTCANDLCSEETDVDDVAQARRLLSPKYEIHDFDACGVVRIEGRAPSRNVD
jgi:hypothetical protein